MKPGVLKHGKTKDDHVYGAEVCSPLKQGSSNVAMKIVHPPIQHKEKSCLS